MSSKNSSDKLKDLLSNIDSKISSGTTSRNSKTLFLASIVSESKVKRIQKFLKAAFIKNRFKLNNRIKYHNYINTKLKDITDIECLEEKSIKGVDGFTIRNIINLEKQIGTEGFNGNIYLTSIKGAFGSYPIVTKLMENNAQNKNEISIMNFITDNIVLQGKSKHFLMCYKSCTCNIADYPKNRALICINEIANGDLNDLIDNASIVSNKKLLYNLLFQCFIAVATFHNSVNNVHQDIHAGNFLWQKNNEKGYYHYIFKGESYYLEACEYNVMLYDFGYARVIRSKKSILKILADFSELMPSFLKNEFEDDLPMPHDDVVKELYSFIDILMDEYKVISEKYTASSSSPKSKSTNYQEVYFKYVIDNIMTKYTPKDMFTTEKPRKIINKIPYYI
jgi:hypothetical protein